MQERLFLTAAFYFNRKGEQFMSNKDFVFKAQKRLQKLCAFGTSKYQIKNKAKALAKEDGSNNWLPIYNNLIRGKIFSYSTFKTYTKNATRFFKWVAQTHPRN